MTDLFAKKPIELLVSEAQESGEHSLKRTLGPFQLTALGVGAVIGAGIFVLSGLGAHYAGPGLMLSFVLSGLGCTFAALCYAEFAAMIPLAGSAYTYAYATLGEIFAWIIGWDLTLEYAMGASTVSSGWSNHFIELLDIFHIKMPLWLAYDHWTALHTAEDIVARQMAQASDPSLVAGTVPFLDKVAAIVSAHSPELAQRAHDLVNAPSIFGIEFGFNLPAFIIALVITAVLVIGIKESARFNSTIVVIVLDADDDFAGNPHNNCPDPINNHGKFGWNWGFADGHAEWVSCRKTAFMITNGFMTSGANCTCN